MSWINHLTPACWSTFWKSNFKQQLGCRFDIMDNMSYFVVLWQVQLFMSWYIRSFFGFTFLNILYFFKYSCTNIFHRRSLYTVYNVMKWKHFPRYWPFVRGIHRSPALTFYFICTWISDWVNNREAGDLRRHCAHYDVSDWRKWLRELIKSCQTPDVTHIIWWQSTSRTYA